MTHLPFIEVLAAEPDEQSVAWRQVSSGLLTLRLFDAWLRHVRRGEAAPDAAWVAAARAQVEAIDGSSTVRPVLLGLLDAMMLPGRKVEVVRGHLLAYAKRLQFDAAWRLAADVFRTFVESRHPLDLSPDAMEAAFQCGYCYRMAGDLDEAVVAYDLGEAIAQAARDTAGMLRARVFQAKITAHRSNLPEAEAQLDAVIAEAEAADCRRVLSLALADRAAVAGRRGQFEAAAMFGYRALRCCDDDLARDRILSDIATALGDAGHRQAARDAHLVLSVTAREKSVAWLSMLNLLDLAVQDGSEVEFERYRRSLAGVPLPVEYQAHYHLLVGTGHERFGRPTPAAAAYRSAMTVAEQHKVNDVLLKAEAALHNLERSRQVAAAPAAPAKEHLTIDDVVRAMHELRETVGAGR